jgi:lipid-A-disaccharide synthase
MKYYIIAGEASGDLHGSNLVKSLIKYDENAEIRAWGGNLMQAAGAQLARHYKEMSFMGFVEVLANLGTIKKNIAFCKKDILAHKPDAIIFIDFSGFNLRIAKWAKEHKFQTNYYIAPQVWASREGRVKKIKRTIDHMYVILPFEKAFYQKHDFQVTFVGHPLLDALTSTPRQSEKALRMEHNLSDKPIIALLPGSRKQEVSRMLNVMLETARSFKDYQFVIAGAPSLDSDFYASYFKKDNIAFVSDKTYELLSCAHAALVTSGTATLETALFNVPQVVCYKGSWLSYQIAKRIITLKYISLVNLIMDKEVVTELIQNELNVKNLTQELNQIIHGPKRKVILEEYQQLKSKLGGPGASDKVASLIVKNM